jgi:cell division protein FtsQ
VARESKKPVPDIRRRLWIGGAAGLFLFASTAFAGYELRRYVLTSPNFLLLRSRTDSITVHGLEHASRTRIRNVFAGDFERSVFSVPLAERRRRLLAIDWVESASVSRILPRRIVVRIRERKPVAFCLLRNHVFLIDAFGVLLEQTPQVTFVLPVLQGADPDEPENIRQQRVEAMLRVQDELGPMGKDISEFNAEDTENIRVITKVDGRAVELILGNGNYHFRYQNFLNHYAEIRKRSPEVRTFDLRLDDRITVKED